MSKPLLAHALSNTGAYALVPPIVVGVLLPAGLLIARTGATPQIGVVYIDLAARLLPALAAWWPAFAFRERIEGDGRELLYFLKRNGEAGIALALALLFWVLLVPFGLAASGVQGHTLSTLVLVMARALFMTTFVFAAGYLLRSSALALILALLFNFVGMVPLESFVHSLTSSDPLVTGGAIPASLIVFYGVISAILLLVGEARSRRFSG